jgi:hypothetical protein
MEGGDNKVSGSIVNLIFGFGGFCSGCRIVYVKNLADLVWVVGLGCLKVGRGISRLCGCRTPLLQRERPFLVGVQFPQGRFVSL